MPVLKRKNLTKHKIITIIELMNEKLTSSLEDYLEAVYMIFEKNNSVKAIDVSRALGVSRASVTEALKKLSDKKLINYGRYDAITITKEGEITAREVIEKHKSLYDFFAGVLGASHDEAHDNACKIEHIVSKDVLKRIIAFTKYYRINYGDEFKNKYKT